MSHEREFVPFQSYRYTHYVNMCRCNIFNCVFTYMAILTHTLHSARVLTINDVFDVGDVVMSMVEGAWRSV